jgi:DNA-binding transcriptional ArsR family regulator
MSREGRCEVKTIDEDRVRKAAAHLVNGLTATRLAETFKALSDPTRVRIISALSHTELCVCDLAATLGMSQSATSHQLRTLRQLRLVKNRKEGRQVYYSLDDEHIYSLFKQGLDHALHS